jgi:RHS repeat-associated protein
MQGEPRRGYVSGRSVSGLRSIRLLAVVVCAMGALPAVGGASASAEETIVHRPEGISEHAKIADNWSGIVESEPAYSEPPGYYVEGFGGGGDGGEEYTEECEKGNIFEHCEGLHTVVDQHAEGPLPSGFTKLEHLEIESEFEGYRTVNLYYFGWKPEPKESELFGPKNEGEPRREHCLRGKPVNCATGNETTSQTDLTVGGRGPTLKLARTYNSRLAAKQTKAGPFGLGWTGSYSAHLEITDGGAEAIVYQDNGSTVTFTRPMKELYIGFGTWVPTPAGPWVAPSGLVQATLAEESGENVYTLPDQTALRFDSLGRLASEVDRDGNTLTTSYESGRLASVTDVAGRKLTFAYNAEGEVESAKDPMGHTVKYTYEGGNLKSVTQPAEVALRWQFKYNGEHELTSETDGRSHVVTTEYNGSQQAISQTDALGRKREWKYKGVAGVESTETTITEPNGAVTVEKFDAAALPTSITRASETAIAATTLYEYNGSDELLAITDPNEHKTEYGYDSAGDRTSEKDANGNEAKWTYGTHDVQTTTTPEGETTTIKREAHGNPEVIERPAPGGTTQKTTYKYDGKGDVESVTDPLERTWEYEYDSYGDRKSEVDPEGDKRTSEYNEDSQATATVSARGNVTGAEPSKYTTKTERDAQGRALTITDPLGHKLKYAYDGAGNVETVTDPNGNKTKHTYDADNEMTKTEVPNKALTETGYDSEGQVISQTDGSKHTTEYKRNQLGEVAEEVDPLGRKTKREYDTAGRLKTLEDAEKRTTTYTYDPGNRVTEVSYSSGNPPTVKFEYDKDDLRVKMADGSGTSSYTYDQLERLTATENGHTEVVKYEYNLANEPKKITYPSGKAVTREYDKDERLEKVTDWLSHATKFSYDPDSDQKAITFPSETKDEDTYAYNAADQMSEVKVKKSTETLASLVYTRDSDGQVKAITSKGLPGEEKPTYEYDKNSRLSKGAGVAYEYDAADNPTKLGAGTYKYDGADELESGTGFAYAYNEVGQRTKTTPSVGPATTYGYDQAGDLTSVERPQEGEVAKIEDAYAYNGEGLRVSQTISGTTAYMVWDAAEPLPLLLSDGANSYVYGPGGLPVEQISSAGTVTYLHHDQAGSTRLLTGSAGTVTGKCTYGAYGTSTCEGSATTPLGYDGQYTSSDTGLIYLRARVYDPATAQFLTVDPLKAITGEPYAYAGDNPVNLTDPNGLEAIPLPAPVAGGCAAAPEVCGAIGVGGADVWLGAKVVNAWSGEEAGNDEGEAEFHTKEAERESEQRCENTPPGYDPGTWTKGPASRAKEPGENFYDPEGGEWHYHPPDDYHEEHWDYKRLPGKLAPWEKISP